MPVNNPKCLPISFWAFITLACLHGGTAWSSDLQEKIQEQKESLRDVKTAIHQKKEILHSFDKKERTLLSQLESMDKKLAFKEEQLESYDLALKKVQKQKEQLENEVDDLKAIRDQFQQYLAFKVVQLYKYRGYSYVKALFSADSYSDLLKRYRYLQIMAQKDKEIIENYGKVYNDLYTKKEALSDREEKVRALDKAFKNKNKEVLAKREERALLLKRIRQEKAVQKELLYELEQSSQSLQAAIDDLMRQRGSLFGNFEKAKGKLPWPVQGEVLTRYGKQKHEKFNTYVFSKGIDIQASHGSDIKAVFSGTVLFADWFKGFGQMLIIDHGKGFYSLYAHLSEIIVPVKSLVKESQLIGQVGETGSLKGPVLYFEIRYHGEPQDPMAWLVSR